MDGRLLAAANFERDEAAGCECGEGLRNEASIDVESVVTGEQREGWFVIANFDGEGVAVCGGNVGWVGDDQVEGFASDRGEEIALEQADGAIVGLSVLFGD